MFLLEGLLYSGFGAQTLSQFTESNPSTGGLFRILPQRRQDFILIGIACLAQYGLNPHSNRRRKWDGKIPVGNTVDQHRGRMAAGVIGHRLFGIPQDRLKALFGIVIHPDSPFVKCAEVFHSGKVAQHPLFALRVFDGDKAVDPDHPRPIYREHLFTEAGVVGEIGQIHPLIRIQSAFARQGADGSGSGKLPQSITNPCRIPPEPVEFALIQTIIGRILAADLGIQQRLVNRHLPSGQDAVTVNPLAGHAIQTLGNLGTFDLDCRGLTRLRIQNNTPHSKTIGGKFIAGAFDKEKDLLSHQAWLVKCRHAAAVGIKPNHAGRAKLHQRHTPAGLLLHHVDEKIIRSGCPTDRGWRA